MTQSRQTPQSSWLGQTIAGRYRIETVLGQGGMSTVYRATDPNLKRTVAIKIIHPHLSADPEFVRRFEQEAAVVAQLRHSNIIQVYDFDHDGEIYYMVLEHVPGQTLQVKLKSLNAAGGRFSLQDIVRIMTTVTDAVTYAHERKMIHRDLKPSNIMLNRKEEPILMDFGVAKMLGEVQHTATGAIVGTAKYMSPEQAQGQRPDERADIYSLGVILFEMVTGQPPFGGESAVSIMMKHVNEPLPDLRQLYHDTPDELIAVIEKALAKSPDYRYQHAADFGNSLRAIDTAILASASKKRARTPTSEQLTSVTPPPAFSQSEPDRAGPQEKSGVSKWAIGIIGAMAVVGAALIAFLIWTSSVQPGLPDGQDGQDQAVAQTGDETLPLSEGMGRVRAGVYSVGIDEADSEHAPRQEVDLAEFWIDRFEVTNDQYAQFLESTDHQPPPTGWNEGVMPAGAKSQPVQGVTWDMAAAYCRWANKRLPTEAEWEVAARGSQGWLYPWGDEERGVDLPRSGFYNVGTIAENRSPFGMFDMAGNVWEWVAEPYAPVDEGHRVLRGGASGFLQDMAYRLQGDPNVPTMAATAGFRCAAEEVLIVEGENVLYSDDFSDPTSGWPVLTEETAFFGYHPPAFYHVEVSTPERSEIVTRAPDFDNIRVESLMFVEKFDTEPGDFRYGLALGRTGEAYYAFTISNRTQTWSVLKGSAAGVDVLAEGDNDTIQGVDIVTADKLTIEAAQDDLTFFINDQQVSRLENTGYTGGEVGFFVENFDQSLAHIHYDALTIRETEAGDVALAPPGVFYSDDFTDPASGWLAIAEDNTIFGYHPPDFYHLEVSAPETHALTSRAPDFDDVTVESEMFIEKTDTEAGDFRYGLVIRRAGDDYYAFTVSTRGNAWYVLKSSADGLEILAQGRDDTIQGQDSESPNLLRVDAQTDNFAFHVNDRLVVQVSDDDYASGEVGFFVENFDETMSHIHYDTLTIREVELGK